VEAQRFFGEEAFVNLRQNINLFVKSLCAVENTLNSVDAFNTIQAKLLKPADRVISVCFVRGSQ